MDYLKVELYYKDEWMLLQGVGMQQEVWPCKLKGLCRMKTMRVIFVLDAIKVLDKVNVVNTAEVQSGMDTIKVL
eukprot:s2692_g16.t1